MTIKKRIAKKKTPKKRITKKNPSNPTQLSGVELLCLEYKFKNNL